MASIYKPGLDMISRKVPRGEPALMATMAAVVNAMQARRITAPLKRTGEDCSILNFRSG